jgi:hypothetical protein
MDRRFFRITAQPMVVYPAVVLLALSILLLTWSFSSTSRRE